MRKIISIILSLGLIFALTACGNSDGVEKQQEEVFTSETVQTKETYSTAQQTEEKTDKPQDTVQNTKQSEFVPEKEQEDNVDTKTLVVYFSCTGTTKSLAEYAADILGADLYEIVPKEAYTDKDLTYYTNGRADQEQNDPAVRPAISGGVQNMAHYDTIILTYPIWHGQAPRIISTFLESYDFSEKTIIPFCTSHSSGIGSSAGNLHSLCSDSVKWFEGRQFEAGTSRKTMEEWLDDINISKPDL